MIDLEQIFRTVLIRPVLNHRAMMRDRHRVRTLVLGSSHALYGYPAGRGEFNLSDVSCDFRLAHAVLNHFLSKGMPRLKKVILFYDVFSPGNRLERSSECFRLAPYDCLYGFPAEGAREDTALGLPYREIKDRYRRFLPTFRPDVPADYRGNLSLGQYGVLCYPDSALEERVRGHLKLNRGMECVHVDAMATLLNEKGVALEIVVSPLRADYLKMLPTNDDLLVAPLKESLLRHPQVRVWNMMRDGCFHYGDFNDMDHLDIKGARKLRRRCRAYRFRHFLEAMPLTRFKRLIAGVEYCRTITRRAHTMRDNSV